MDSQGSSMPPAADGGDARERHSSQSPALEATWPWRVGEHVGRTIYACPPGSSYRNGEVLIGLMDSPELAKEAVEAHNFVVGDPDWLHHD